MIRTILQKTNKINYYLANKWLDNTLKNPSIKEQILINKLRNELAKKETTIANPSWHNFRADLIKHVYHFDPRNFLRWKIIQQTMFMPDSSWRIIEELQNDPQWKELWSKAVKEVSFGNPVNSPKYKESSGNILLHLYHLLQFKKFTNLNFSDLDLIVDFGGGYGCMARLLYKLGFKGTYIIYDLREFSALQYFYLNGVGLKTDYIATKNMTKISLANNPELLEKRLKKFKRSKNLFIATWSISETPLELREKIMKIVENFNYFLFGYQRNFDQINNQTYFKKLQKKLDNKEWKSQYEKDWDGFYLFAKPKT